MIKGSVARTVSDRGVFFHFCFRKTHNLIIFSIVVNVGSFHIGDEFLGTKLTLTG